MDWLRRNWPDVLIGVVFLAVVIAIIFTLLNGGFNLSFGGNRGGSTSTPPSLSTPITPGGTTVDPTPPETAQTPDPTPITTPGGVTVLAPDGTEVPLESTETPTTPAVAPPETLPTTTETAPVAPTTTTPPATTPPVVTTPPVSTAATAQSGEVSYRVSVGAFGNRENAERLAQDVQAQNYPVFLAEQGTLTIVLVGPYSSENNARAIAQQLSSGPLAIEQPTVYRYEPDEAPTAAGTTQPAAPAAPAASTPPAATSPPATQPSTPAATTAERNRFLQTGAFNTRESTLPQRETLESLGFVVSERNEDGFIKLLVGPFTTDEIEGARTRLLGAGIESFPR